MMQLCSETREDSDSDSMGCFEAGMGHQNHSRLKRGARYLRCPIDHFLDMSQLWEEDVISGKETFQARQFLKRADG